jgi:hypothetical protein
VGLLNSAVGAGAIAGSALTVLLVGRRLVVPIVVGFACWGLALSAIGLVPARPPSACSGRASPCSRPAS